MLLEFAAPDPALTPHVSTYFLHGLDYPLIEDRERADVGYLRFIFSGSGSYRYGDGRTAQSAPVMILGPSTEIADYTVHGPLRTFGAVLLPEFWGGIVNATAESVANYAIDGRPLLGPGAQACYDDLCQIESVTEMGRRLDKFLLTLIKPLPQAHLNTITLIGEWLSQFPIPATTLLYARSSFSERQVMRIAKRYFGAPPKMLARKFRALRTASRIIGTRGRLAEDLVSEYADLAHMVREVKHFTGMTPRTIQVASSPIMQITLHPANFRHDAPWT